MTDIKINITKVSGSASGYSLQPSVSLSSFTNLRYAWDNSFCIAVPKVEPFNFPAGTSNPSKVDYTKLADLDTAKASSLDLVATKRYTEETRGITVGGATVSTDRDSQSMVTGALNFTQLNPGEVINFKSDSGWVELNAAQMETIANAVAIHVQACFAREGVVSGLISSATTHEELQAAITQIDTGWPV